jgi:hypothetical protein
VSAGEVRIRSAPEETTEEAECAALFRPTLATHIETAKKYRNREKAQARRMSDSRDTHFLPQFLLRGWGNSKGKVTV